MATTGTFQFNPSLGQLALTAFSRIKVKRTELSAEKMEDLRNEANLLQVQWANEGVLLWEQDLQTFTMVPGQQIYSIPANTVMVLDLYITPGVFSGGGQNNRLIYPFSRTDFASIGNPNTTGFPDSFFFLRTTTPQLYFWPVPDNNTTYTVSYWRYHWLQDASLANAGNVDVHYLFLDAFVAGVAHRLCRHYGPMINGQVDVNFENLRKADAKEAFDLAMKQNVENVALYITPGMEGYYR
jgi:hypothetical protein